MPHNGAQPDIGFELGEIPQGWEVKPIREVVETLGGGTPSTSNPAFCEMTLSFPTNRTLERLPSRNWGSSAASKATGQPFRCSEKRIAETEK
jgi:hypothetical protein